MENQNPSVAVVGCGHWGKNLVRNFHATGSLALICDDGEAGCARAREIAPDVPVVSEYDRVLTSPVAGIVIATPAATHYRMAQLALTAGKDVFVEKPLALTYNEGEHLVRLANENGLILMVGHVLEYHPAIARLNELVHTGELGKIQYVYSNRLNLGKIRREENILWSFAPHDIAVILRLMGTLPFQVSATGGSYVQPNIPDVTITNLLFDNGVRAHIYVSWLHPFKEQRLVVIGSSKMASFDDVAKRLVIYDQRIEVREGEPVPVGREGEELAFSPDEPLRRECEAFLEAIERRTAPVTDGRSGLDVLKVLQVAQRSLVMNGEAVSLPFEPAADAPGLA